LSDHELFERADRVKAETRRLIAEQVIRADKTLRVLHRCVVGHEHTLELLERAIERLERAGVQSSLRQKLAEAERNPLFRASSKEDGARDASESRAQPSLGAADSPAGGRRAGWLLSLNQQIGAKCAPWPDLFRGLLAHGLDPWAPTCSPRKRRLDGPVMRGPRGIRLALDPYSSSLSRR